MKQNEKTFALGLKIELNSALRQAQEVIKTLENSIQDEEIYRNEESGLIPLAMERVAVASARIKDAKEDITRAIDDLLSYEKE